MHPGYEVPDDGYSTSVGQSETDIVYVHVYRYLSKPVGGMASHRV